MSIATAGSIIGAAAATAAGSSTSFTRNESVGHLLPFARKEVLYKQGWALKYMHYVWAYYAAYAGRSIVAPSWLFVG